MLKAGDTIKCHDAEDAAELVGELARGGYDTEFVYQKDGERGIWLEITEVEHEAIERQVFVTWYTPEEKMPPEDVFVVVTLSGTGPYVTYDHALMLAEWDSVEGWIIDGLNADTESFTVHAWCDLEPYGGVKG